MEKFRELVYENKLPVGLCILGLILLVSGLFSQGLVSSKNSPANASDFPKDSLITKEDVNSEIKLDISGAVKKPGVYAFNKNSRVEDALRAAGGLASNANMGFVSKSLNLSQKLSDGVKIYIPFEGESAPATLIMGATSSQNAKIGVNSATQAQLEDLPGVGAVTAQKIIQARPFNSLEELISKKAVSNSTFLKIKASVDLN